MKNFSNCSYDEFVAQITKFRAPFLDWIKQTNAAEIRKKHIGALPDDATLEQRVAAHNAFVGEVEIAALEKCPDLTRELLCIATFTDPADFGSRSMNEYIEAAFDMYGNKVTRDFFTLWLTPKLTTSSKQ